MKLEKKIAERAPKYRSKSKYSRTHSKSSDLNQKVCELTPKSRSELKDSRTHTEVLI